MAKLEVEIRKKTGSFLLDVSFTAENEIMALLGASGCGKSMTLKCIAGIERPDRGRIALDDRVLFDSAKHIDLAPQKRKVGYMFQDYALFPNMTVLENILIAVHGGKKDARRSRAEDLIVRFHLEGLEKHLPGQLSGGQKQRVAMARMLAAEPEIILLDEPFSALDSHLKWELEQEMKDTLEKMGRTTLFVSHNRDEVYRLCQSVAVMNQGRLEPPADVKEFFAHPGSVTAARLSGCKNISAASRLDAHSIRADDWNLVIPMEKEIPEGIRAVGIRAHYLIPVFAEEAGAGPDDQENRIVFHIAESRLLEDPFEWNLSFRGEGADGWIQWKAAKSDFDRKRLPVCFSVREEDILLLTE